MRRFRIIGALFCLVCSAVLAGSGYIGIDNGYIRIVNGYIVGSKTQVTTNVTITTNITVSGTLDPDVTGTYYYQSVLNGYPIWTNVARMEIYWSLYVHKGYRIYGIDENGYWWTNTVQTSGSGTYLPLDPNPFGQYSTGTATAVYNVLTNAIVTTNYFWQ